MSNKVSKKLPPQTLARVNRFTVSMPINSNIKDIYPDFTDDMSTINIYKPKIPGLSTPSVKLPTRGRHVSISGGMSKISPVPFEFDVDAHFLVWSLYYSWMMLHKDQTDGTGFQFRGENGIREDNNPLTMAEAVQMSPYNDVVISGYDGFDNLVIECTLFGAHPTELADLDFTQQEGSEQVMKSNVVLEYDHHAIRFPKLEELIPNRTF